MLQHGVSGSWSCGQTDCIQKRTPRHEAGAGAGGWAGGAADGDQTLPDGVPKVVRGRAAAGEFECTQTGPPAPGAPDGATARPAARTEGWTRRVQLVRRDGRDVSTLYGREGGGGGRPLRRG